MNYILDTHIVLWGLTNPDKLNQNVKNIICDESNLIFLSIASLWEIQMKESLGKLKVPKNLREAVSKESIELLSITADHIDTLKTLPMHHKDPFDRMIIAQAIHEKFTIITADSQFKPYKIAKILN